MSGMDWGNAFASDGTTKLFLDAEERFYVVIKDELTVAEDRGISLSSLKGISRPSVDDGDEPTEKRELFEIDMAAGAFRKVLTYLVDWNLSGKDGKTIPISSPKMKHDAVKNLKPAMYAEIERVIDAEVSRRKAGKLTTPELTSSGATSS